MKQNDTKVGSILLGAFGIVLLFFCIKFLFPDLLFQDLPEPSVSQGPTEIITPNVLINDYANNEVAAEAKWQGTSVYMFGKIASIDRDNTVVIGESYQTGVRCQFEDNEKHSLLPLSRGENIQVQGEVVGQFAMKNCKVVSNFKKD